MIAFVAISLMAAPPLPPLSPDEAPLDAAPLEGALPEGAPGEIIIEASAEDPALEAARQRMEELLQQALSDGVLDPRESGAGAAGGIVLYSDGGAPLDNPAGRASMSCLADSDLALGFSKSVTDLREGIGGLRRGLVGEFDAPDMKAVALLAKAYLGLGMIDEYRALIKSFPEPFPSSAALDEIAHIIERSYGRGAARLAGGRLCPGAHGLWQALAISEKRDLLTLAGSGLAPAPPRTRPAVRALKDGALTALDALPVLLRSEIAPRFAIALMRDGAFDPAIALYEEIKTYAPENDYLSFLSALIARYEKRPEDAEAELDKLKISGSAIAARALIEFQDDLAIAHSDEPEAALDRETLARLNEGGAAGEALNLQRAVDGQEILTIDGFERKLTLLSEALETSPAAAPQIKRSIAQTFLAALSGDDAALQAEALDRYLTDREMFDGSRRARAVHLAAAARFRDLTLMEDARAAERAAKAPAFDAPTVDNFVAAVSPPLAEEQETHKIADLNDKLDDLKTQKAATPEALLDQTRAELDLLRAAFDAPAPYEKEKSNG